MAASRRIVLHFVRGPDPPRRRTADPQDYDCFYAQVVENRDPALAGRCVGVTQKSILATCNYAARRRGVRKLMRIAEARVVCPDLVLVDGEDLSPFRDASKRLFRLVINIVGGAAAAPVERLGLDELFVDATALVAANLGRLHALPDRSQAFFELPALLDDDDDVPGFAFDGRSFSGCVVGEEQLETQDHLAFLVASHLASYLRRRLADAGYTSSAGIAANKVLAKLAGKQNKPANQTTLLSSGSSNDPYADSVIRAFMDPLPLRSVPWIGFRTTSLLEAYMEEQPLTVGVVRQHSGMSPHLLDAILGADTASSFTPPGIRVWGLLHGVDDTPVCPASDLPAQISIEDTYGGPRRRLLPGSAGPVSPLVAAELRKLAMSLLRRMHVDLRREDGGAWRARPRTLRLTLRAQLADAASASASASPFHRTSRSQPLPAYALSLTAPLEHIAGRLVAGSLVPMYRRLAAAVDPARRLSAWTVSLLNVCVANMTPVAEGDGIAALFRRHEKVEETEEYGPLDWPDADVQPCRQCGRLLPSFAGAAHARFHLLGD